VVQKIAQLIAKGMTEEQACLRVCVNHASFRTARHRNAEFETAVKEGQAEFLDESLDVIRKGARGWQGLAWILERRHGEQFRRTTGMELHAHLGHSSQSDLLARPLAHWSREDLDESVGAWRLLQQWPPDKLHELRSRYERDWGPVREMSDEQLEWCMQVWRRTAELENDTETLAMLDRELAESLLTPARPVDTLPHPPETFPADRA
jgi:hypothetical protein